MVVLYVFKQCNGNSKTKIHLFIFFKLKEVEIQKDFEILNLRSVSGKPIIFLNLVIESVKGWFKKMWWFEIREKTKNKNKKS